MGRPFVIEPSADCGPALATDLVSSFTKQGTATHG